MIVDKLENAHLYPLNEKMKKAFAFLQSVKDPKTCAFGKRGDEIFAMYQSYDDEQVDWKFEAHKEYIDVQYIVSGRETFGWKPCKDVENYNAEKDCALFKGENKAEITLGAGEFIVFFPTDAHAPKMKNPDKKTIEKIVVKVKV